MQSEPSALGSVFTTDPRTPIGTLFLSRVREDIPSVTMGR